MKKPKSTPNKAEKPDEKEWTVISLRVPNDLLKRAKNKSQKIRIPISVVLRKALEEWIQKKEIFVLYDPDDLSDNE